VGAGKSRRAAGVSFAREGRAGAQGCRTARAEEKTAWKGPLCAERTRARVRRSRRDGLGYGIVIPYPGYGIAVSYIYRTGLFSIPGIEYYSTLTAERHPQSGGRKLRCKH